MSDTASAGARPSYSAPALTKGLEVLELLATAAEALTMKEIADGLGRSKGEIFRMLVALQERGYIERDPASDAYSLSDKLFRLGLHTPAQQDLMSAAMPELAALALATGQSPHLVVIHHGRTVVTAAVPGGEDMSFTLNLGYGRLATDSTSGQVMLAFSPPTRAALIVDECEAQARAPIDRALLGRQLDAIRDRGYELRESRDFVGITDICCPIIGMNGSAIAAVIISYVNRHNRESRHVQTAMALQQSCMIISAKLSPLLTEERRGS
ncbi:IclR family transcriptional regulator [Aureimonas frigidaquae]|uniref:IclR family transcriptional regulator n=1 Tax=Aureimonas frigidaquae TaxID=424757 RepID=UPI0012ED0150|nr:IclR family transcriptional regulator [Aureimonas frigidaquae]